MDQDPESEGDKFYLSEVSPRDKPWDVHRAETDQVRALYDTPEFSRYSERMSNCSQRLQFALSAQDTGQVILRLYAARFCRVRHCPVCQWRRRLQWQARFFQLVPKLQRDYPTARYIFLTLTVKNCPLPELRKTLNWMNKSWERLTKRKEFPAMGFVKVFEVTRPEAGWAHPHFHALLMVPASYFKHNYLSQAKWTDLWQSCLKVNYIPIVDVRAVSAKPKKGSTLHDQMGKALCETLKYSVKPTDLLADRDWLLELTSQIHNTRAISVGGLLRKYLSELDPDDLIGFQKHEIEPDDPRFTVAWEQMIKRYIKK